MPCLSPGLVLKVLRMDGHIGYDIKTKPPSRWTSIDTTETSYLVTELEPNTLYEFAVKVKRDGEESLWSISIFERTEDGPASNRTNVETTCEKITVPLCTSALPYQDAALPNLFGNTNQGKITAELTKNWLPIAFSGCSADIQTFLCVAYLPPCGVPLPPCREVCQQVRSDCQAVIDTNADEFTWPEELACESLPTEASGECIGPNTQIGGMPSPDPPGFCEPVTIAMCEENRFTPLTPPPGVDVQDYPLPPWSNYTMYPNFIGHNEQGSAEYLTIMVEDVVFIECSPFLKFFVCLAVAPMCTPVPVPIPPCRELCEMATAPCLEYMEKEGIVWPEELACENFPPSSVSPEDGPPVCIGFDGGIGPEQGQGNFTDEGNSTQGEDGESDGESDGGPKGPGREQVFIPPDVEEGTATCEPLMYSTMEICPGLEYTETIFPNTLGHRDQEEAYEILNAQSDVLKQECAIGQFLCVLAFPPCKRYGANNDSAVPLIPCREECAYTETTCVDLDFDQVIQSVDKWSTKLDCSKYPERYANPPLCWEINNGFLKPEHVPTPSSAKGGEGDGKGRKGDGDGGKGDLTTEDGKCSTDISETCQQYGIKSTAFPNAFNHANSTYAIAAYEEVQPLIDSMCHPEISAFTCAALFPVCDPAVPDSIMPCHETCRKVWKACKSTAQRLSLDRPKVFSCSKLYTPEAEGLCISSVSAPTVPPKVKSIDRQEDNAKIVVWPEDDSAKFFNTKLFGPTGTEEQTVNVSTSEKTTTLTFENLDPERQYYTKINTGNYFGESPAIVETIPKHTGLQCQPLEIEMCKGYGYDMALADGHPNSLGHIDQAEADLQLQQFLPLINVGCSPYMQQLLCWVFAPGCTPDSTKIIPPCKETCLEARFGCENLMNAFGYEWPDFLECDLFPFKNDSESRHCEGGKRLSAWGEISSDEGAEYHCVKTFAGPQPLWYDSEGNAVGNDTTAVVFSEIVSDKMTRLVVGETSEEYAGIYTCRSGDNKLEANIRPIGPAGTCYDNNHDICNEFFEKFYLPNRHNQTRERDAYLSVNSFLPLIATNCSEFISRFACYYYLPNFYCQKPGNDTESGTTDAPCSELCYKAQLDCAEEMEEIGFLWPEEISCDSLPSAEDGGYCDNFGVTVEDLLSEGNVTELVTEIYEDLNATDATDIYPTDATDFATEFYTEEPFVTEFGANYTEETFVTEVMNETDADIGNLTCAGLKPRRYDIEDLGSDCLFRGWADVQAQGAANDYCRVVAQGGPKFLSCALAGATDDHVYTSPNASVDWFDAGHTDTWYMKDEDGDGRDDYCRCVGAPPDTVVSCMKADDSGFMGHDDFQIDDSSECEYKKVNPFFGAP
ncbi:uncharacterized protein [Amphiura filiformis]|uniref:uncharacterized protein isoform X2 n=1 Tax=Amphiura filiformis TaxID=82378 RepID=UPI003B214118